MRPVLFDFDGTLSLLRSGWMRVMVPMMIEVLAECQTGESEDELRQVVEAFVWRLTGKETICQMRALAAEVERRGGASLDPRVYKKRYLERLWAVIGGRVEALREGRAKPDQYLVPGARRLLEGLRARGLTLYLASGTDEDSVKEEAGLLDIARYFNGGIFGARDDDQGLTKRALVERIVSLRGPGGGELLAFGDGYVEIEEVKKAGGVAVGVATSEPECRRPDEWKRQRLAGVGADYIIANYLEYGMLLEALLGDGCGQEFREGSRYEVFDRSRLAVRPLAERTHDLGLEQWLSLDDPTPEFAHPDLAAVAERLDRARSAGAARILMMGAHVLRAGVNRHAIDMLARGWIDHVATNGAVAIHDYELARMGATTESVDRYIRNGQFGLWRETGELNEWICEAARGGLGLGENIGRRIQESDFPHKDLSIFAAAWRYGVPATTHAGIGYDIIHEVHAR